MGLGEDLKRFADRTGAHLNQVVQKTALDIFIGIILNTPVDTGAARANWVATKDAPNEGMVPGPASGRRGEPSTQPAASNPKHSQRPIQKATREVESFTEPGQLFLVNNLPYIRALEYGSSQQAPNGMVRISVQRAEQAIQTAINSIGGV